MLIVIEVIFLNDTADVYSFLEKANHDAFNSADYDKAYHVLASLLHFAQSMGNVSKLKEVSETAKIQAEQIDALSPEYHHSTQNSASRGNGNIFVSLASQAGTACKIINSKHIVPKARLSDDT